MVEVYTIYREKGMSEWAFETMKEAEDKFNDEVEKSKKLDNVVVVAVVHRGHFIHHYIAP